MGKFIFGVVVGLVIAGYAKTVEETKRAEADYYAKREAYENKYGNKE
jgi:hypothetical protein